MQTPFTPNSPERGSTTILWSSPPSPSLMESPSGRASDSMRRASAFLLDLGAKRSRRSIIDVRDSIEIAPLLNPDSEEQHQHIQYETIPEAEAVSPDEPAEIPLTNKRQRTNLKNLGRIPAILLACLLNLMIGIPFGVSYFPVGWGSPDDGDDDEVHGDFPVSNRVSLGIRMFLFSTIVGQVAFTFSSKFKNPISCQMVENVPFYHALAYIVIEEQGYGVDALGTLIVVFGMSSMLVGALFYSLGALQYGRIVYFFPSHVLVGCIGGIGVFIVVTALEVTLNSRFEFSLDGVQALFTEFHLLGLVLGLEIALRLLDYATHDSRGRPRFPLLAPTYFCMITPVFYLGLLAFGISMKEAEDAGYFFPASREVSGQDSSFNKELWTMWRVIDFRTISWTAVSRSFPTMIALAAFSLIHVPINIPAFGISTDVDTDMNAELIAHGWSNFMSGVFGGLQNYMTYSNSVLYAKSGGEGKISSLVVVALTSLLYAMGPQIATYIPRCMAGTLLLHIGIDLFLEGVVDSYGKHDKIEYAFIWVITIVMTAHGMTAALIAGIIAAMSAYAAQSIAHHNPIRGTMNASTLRSSRWNRSHDELKLLRDPQLGRSRILILQLQGHLFFGNVVQITDSMKRILSQKRGTQEEPFVVILDFTLVVGMDSSAAHAIAKLKKVMHKTFHVEVTIFVTGSGDGFPCEYALSHELCKACEHGAEEMVDWRDVSNNSVVKEQLTKGSVSLSQSSSALKASMSLLSNPNGRVCESLDMALVFAEDILIARANIGLQQMNHIGQNPLHDDPHEFVSFEEEKYYALKYLKNLCPNTGEDDVKRLLSYFVREQYKEHDIIWKQGDASTSAKLLVQGSLMSYLEGTDETESIAKANMLGELGLVQQTDRFTTVVCSSETCVLFSLRRKAWNKLAQDEPRLARLVDGIVIRYLAHRVQHVSNRIFETRCLPI